MSRRCARGVSIAALVLASLFVFGRANAAKPVEYVKVCSLYGAGFYYIPGTDTCIKLAGYVRVGSSGTYIEQPAPASASTSGLRTAAYNSLQQSCGVTYGGLGRVAALPWGEVCVSLNPGATYQTFAPGQAQGRTSTYNWSGFYIGINGGGAWGGRDVSATELFNGDPFFTERFGTRNVTGGFGGAQVGFNWQKGNWVLGMEADVQRGSINGMSRATVEPYVGPGSFITVGTSECIDVFGTLRGRVGYAWGGTLLYGTAGAAVADTTLRVREMDSFGWDARATFNTTRVGVAAGLGVEYKVTDHLSLKAEYLYVSLGDGDVKAREFNGALPTATEIWTSNRLDYSVVRGGLNWKFDGGGTYPVLTPGTGR